MNKKMSEIKERWRDTELKNRKFFGTFCVLFGQIASSTEKKYIYI